MSSENCILIFPSGSDKLYFSELAYGVSLSLGVALAPFSFSIAINQSEWFKTKSTHYSRQPKQLQLTWLVKSQSQMCCQTRWVRKDYDKSQESSWFCFIFCKIKSYWIVCWGKCCQVILYVRLSFTWKGVQERYCIIAKAPFECITNEMAKMKIQICRFCWFPWCLLWWPGSMSGQSIKSINVHLSACMCARTCLIYETQPSEWI